MSYPFHMYFSFQKVFLIWIKSLVQIWSMNATRLSYTSNLNKLLKTWILPSQIHLQFNSENLEASQIHPKFFYYNPYYIWPPYVQINCMISWHVREAGDQTCSSVPRHTDSVRKKVQFVFLKYKKHATPDVASWGVWISSYWLDLCGVLLRTCICN